MWKIFSTILILFYLMPKFNLIELNRYKIIYADDIFAFDFSDVHFTYQNGSNLSSNHSLIKQLGHISENLLKGSFICYILFEGANLTDIEIKGNDSNNFLLEYDMQGSNSLLEPCSMYSLKLSAQLDRETKSEYDLEFRRALSNQLIFNLSLLLDDVNDNEPKFEKNFYEFSLNENNQVPTCLGFIRAMDPDHGINGTVDYYLLNDTLIAFNTNSSPNNQSISNNLFYLNETNGELCVNSKMDREVFFKYTIHAVAIDRGLLKSSQSALIEINIRDENDNEPLFFFRNLNNDSSSGISSQFYYLNAAENSSINTFIAWFKAYDLDDGLNSELTYQVNNTDLFSIDTKGVLRNTRPIRLISNQNQLTNETSNTFYFTNDLSIPLQVKVKDKGTPVRMNSVIFHVKLMNDLEQTKRIRLELEPNKTLLHVKTNSESFFHRPLIRVIPFAEYNNARVQYSYQLMPLATNKNCSQEDVLKLFTLNKNGEIWMSQLAKSSKILAKSIFCSLKIKVIDTLQPIQVSSEVELSFSLTDLPLYSNILKLDRNMKEITLLNTNDAILSINIIFAYIAILLIIFLIVFGFLFYNIKSKRRHTINNQEYKPSKDKDSAVKLSNHNPPINKVNMNKLFKWFDALSTTETPYSHHSTSSASSSSTSTTSCDSSLDQNLIGRTHPKHITILTRTSTKIFNKQEPKQNSAHLVFFKSKSKRNKSKTSNSECSNAQDEGDLSGFNETDLPKYMYVNKTDHEKYFASSNSISLRPDFKTSTSNSNDDLQQNHFISSQIGVNCSSKRKHDRKSSSLSSFSTSSSLSLSSGRKSTPEEQLERFEKIYYDNKKYLDTNLSQFLFDITLK